MRLRTVTACFLWALIVVGVLPMTPSAFAVTGQGDAFTEITGAHFRVRFTMESERTFAGEVLRRAEAYFLRVADDIGYSRYQDPWTWERRVSIVLYPDQFAYVRFTGAPAWSRGHAGMDARIFRERTIVSWSGQPGFLDEILPHEIAHLMLWDFLGTSRPGAVWFEEGVAQLEESGRAAMVQGLMSEVVRSNAFIPLTALQTMSITGEKDSAKVSLFYAQSLSIVVFLIHKYGRDAWRLLCREFRDSKSLDAALRRAYPGIIGSWEELQARWVAYLSDR